MKGLIKYSFFLFPPASHKGLILEEVFESKWETVVRTPVLANKLSMLTSLIKIDLGQYDVSYNYKHV